MPEPVYGVTVVIPTIGRPQLSRAVESALAQDIEVQPDVVVVADVAEDGDLAADIRTQIELYGASVRVVFTGGGKGAAHSRNVGVAESETEWIAFLDDDDWWHPSKLSSQLVLARAGATVIASRVRQVDYRGNLIASGVPTKPFLRGQRVAEYLFLARRFGTGRASLFTSTLLVLRTIASDVPWDPTLARHQDWDWLLRLERDHRCILGQAGQDLTVIVVGSPSSISAKSDWRSSLQWARDTLSNERPQVLADFLAAQTLRYALQARSFTGVIEVLRSIIGSRRLPSISCCVIGAAGVVGRSRFERGMRLIK